MADPRGIRNHNPLNIKRAGSSWVGLAAAQRDLSFLAFEAPEYGIRAAAKILQTYQEQHAINTLFGVINRWAPESDKNDTASYLTAVEIWADLEPHEPLNLSDYETVFRLLRAMCRFENGKPPEARGDYWYPAAVWEKGLRLAGLIPGKPLTQSRTLQGTSVAVTGAATAFGLITDTLGLPPAVAELLPSALSGLSEASLALLAITVAIAGNLYAAYARRDDKLKGRL